MRELELFRQHLVKEREKRLTQAHRLAVSTKNREDYVAIVVEAKAAELLGSLLSDLKALDQDSGEFVKRFLL